MQYRPDIDGLRAIAILGVLVFHVQSFIFPGGFVGVDVFFTISGYLITKTLLRDQANGDFSLAAFYERRIRRILPVLALIILCVSMVSFWLMLPSDLENFGLSLLSTSFFVSNIYFWQETSYFAGPVHHNPLLHTWSLSVEEQFYIFFPALLWALQWRLKKPKLLIIVLIVISLLSLTLAQIGATHKPIAAFYNTPTRMWELLIGALLAFAPALQIRWAGLVGITSILLAYLLFTQDTVFPGLSALLPCLGAVLLICSNPEISKTSWLLATRPMVFIGKISYSLYLWHWPVFALFRYGLLRSPTEIEKIILVALCFMLATASWYWVEQRFRYPKSSSVSRKKLFMITLIGVSIYATAGAVFYVSKGLPSRLPLDIVEIANERGRHNPLRDQCHAGKEISQKLEPCLFGALKKQPDFMIWGDSHADHWVPVLDEVARQTGKTGLQRTKMSCPPLLGVELFSAKGDYRSDCSDYNQWRLLELEHKPSIKTVILSARWPIYTQGSLLPNEAGYGGFYLRSPQAIGPNTLFTSREALERGLHQMIDALRKAGKNIMIIAPTPEALFEVPQCVAQQKRFGLNSQLCAINPNIVALRHAAMNDILKSLPPAMDLKIIWPTSHLCDQASCKTMLNGKVIYRDDDHLSVGSVKELAKFWPDLDDFPRD